MLKNPFIRAILASLYIVVMVICVNFAPEGGDDTILAPIIMLSLLVLSVATMGFLFFLEPLRMFLDGRRDEAVTFFLKTLGTFALLIAIFVAIILFK